MHIARSLTHKNVRKRRRGSWQRSSRSLSPAVPASVSVYRFRCPPREPSSNSLQKKAFGYPLSPMRSTWPVQRSWAVIRNA